MPTYPFTYNTSELDTGRRYYGGLLAQRRGEPGPRVWSGGEQQVPHETPEQAWGIAKFVFVSSAIAGAGFMPMTWRGQPGGAWDLYVHTMRTMEEYSPAKLLRTFQASNIFSPLETVSRAPRVFTPEIVRQIAESEAEIVGGKLIKPSLRPWLHYLGELSGKDFVGTEVLSKGFHFSEGQLRLGTTIGQGDILLANAAIVRNPNKSARFMEAYARALNFKVPNKLFETAIPFQGGEEMFGFAGGQTSSQAAFRYGRGITTEMVSRFNRLLRAPAQMEPFETVFGALRKGVKVGSKRYGLMLDVAEGSDIQMMKGLIKKWGIVAPAMALSYQWLDYKARNASILDNTIFSEGITAGLATAWTKANLAYHKAADVVGWTDYGKYQEEVAPGSTSLARLSAFPIMGALGGAGLYFGYKTGLAAKYQFMGQRMMYHAGAEGPDKFISFAKAQELGLAEKFTAQEELFGKVVRKLDANVAVTEAEEVAKIFRGENLFARGGRWLIEKAGKKHYPFLGEIGPSKLAGLIGAGIGLLPVLPYLPGALAPKHTAEELQELYEGKRDVPIRKGRFWELGRSEYRGGQIDRHRPHWYRRLLDRSKEKAIWGPLEEERGGELSPFEKWRIKETTYELERAHYYDYPAPMTGTFGEDIPFVGPLVAGTIGKLIKPPRLMHTQEWLRAAPSEGAEKSRLDIADINKVQALHPPAGMGERRAPELGEVPPGIPISPYGFKGIVGEQFYRFTEQIGLPGFMLTAIKERLTGTPDLFDQEMQLETSRRAFGYEREYWDKEYGGAFGLSEVYRRLFPHRRRQIQQYNPIENTMPSWMPTTGDRSIDFRHGIPFSKIPEGEMRLPGPGYAARHPYLEGVDPEDYPLIERFRILADTAKFSSKFSETLEQVRGARRANLFSDEEEAIYKRTMEQLKASKKRKEFFDYQYRDKERTTEEERWRGASTRVEKPPHRNIFEKAFGGFWETLAHNAETPLEYLTPISPASKLVHMRTALEDYTKEQVWGTSNAFWQHPWRDFLRPFAESVKPDVGEPDIPKHIQRRRDLEEYFDILKYLKAARLKRMAQKHGDTEAAKEFESMSRETLAGINPYAFDFSHIFRALPRRERDYFSEFVKAGLDEREEIIDLVPENEQKLYEARWKLKDASDKAKAVKRNLLSDDEKEKALDDIADTWREARLEGMPTSQDLWKEYLATRLKGETYVDWYRRTRLIEKRLEGLPLPGPDFVGWHPSVDLEDVKMKVVENLGESFQDFDLWPSRLQSLAHKPYINKEAVDDIMNSDEGLDRTEIRRRIVDLFTDLDIKNMDISVVQGGIMQEGNEIDIEMLEDRDDEIREMGRRGELEE